MDCFVTRASLLILFLAAGGCTSGPPPTKPVRVFIMAGQSNMVGYGIGDELPVELRQQEGIWYDFYNPDARADGPVDSTYRGATSMDWELLAPKGDKRYYGPEITFGNAISAAYPNEQIAIIKVAQGGTNLIEHWARGLPEAPPSDNVHYKSQLYHALLGSLDSATYGLATENPLQYPDEVTRVDNALSRLVARGWDYKLGGLIWMQGENEAGWDAANSYGAQLSAFVAALRQDLNAPGLRVVLGRISDNLYANNGGPISEEDSEYLATVRDAQMAFGDNDPYAAWVDTDDLDPRAEDDYWHFSSVSYQLLGARFAQAYLGIDSALHRQLSRAEPNSAESEPDASSLPSRQVSDR